MDVKVKLLRYYVFSVLYYGVESRTLIYRSREEAGSLWDVALPQNTASVLDAKGDLRRMGKEMEVPNTVKCCKLQYLGHIMWNESRYQLLQCILQGKVYVKRGPSKRRIF